MPERKYSSAAERQAAHRLRREALVSDLQALIDAIVSACDNGRCYRLVKNLPDEPQAAARELTERITGIALVKFPINWRRPTPRPGMKLDLRPRKPRRPSVT